MAAMTMEQIFAMIWAAIFVVGVALGFLIEWVFRKENEKNDGV